jgi:hypothetical protein
VEEIAIAIPAVREGNKRKSPGNKSSARRIAESRIASVETEIRPEFKLEIDNRVEGEQLQLTKERTSNRIIRKPIATKATKQVVGLQHVGDWTFWKVLPPPKRKQVKTARGNNTGDPATLRKFNRLIK